VVETQQPTNFSARCQHCAYLLGVVSGHTILDVQSDLYLFMCLERLHAGMGTTYESLCAISFELLRLTGWWRSQRLAFKRERSFQLP